PAPPALPPRVLPGVQPGGSVLLPNGWSLRPAGKQTPLGDYPVNIALHPSGKYLAVLHAGFSEHDLHVVELHRGTPPVVCRVRVDQTFYGLYFSPDGKTLFASGAEYETVHAYDFQDGLLGRHREIAVAGVSDTFVPAGLATDAAGKTLFAAGT